MGCTTSNLSDTPETSSLASKSTVFVQDFPARKLYQLKEVNEDGLNSEDNHQDNTKSFSFLSASDKLNLLIGKRSSRSQSITSVKSCEENFKTNSCSLLYSQNQNENTNFRRRNSLPHLLKVESDSTQIKNERESQPKIFTHVKDFDLQAKYPELEKNVEKLPIEENLTNSHSEKVEDKSEVVIIDSSIKEDLNCKLKEENEKISILNFPKNTKREVNENSENGAVATPKNGNTSGDENGNISGEENGNISGEENGNISGDENGQDEGIEKAEDVSFNTQEHRPFSNPQLDGKFHPKLKEDVPITFPDDSNTMKSQSPILDGKFHPELFDEKITKTNLEERDGDEEEKSFLGQIFQSFDGKISPEEIKDPELQREFDALPVQTIMNSPLENQNNPQMNKICHETKSSENSESSFVKSKILEETNIKEDIIDERGISEALGSSSASNFEQEKASYQAYPETENKNWPNVDSFDDLSDVESIEDLPCSLAASSSGLVMPRPLTSKRIKNQNLQRCSKYQIDSKENFEDREFGSYNVPFSPISKEVLTIEPKEEKLTESSSHFAEKKCNPQYTTEMGNIKNYYQKPEPFNIQEDIFPSVRPTEEHESSFQANNTLSLSTDVSLENSKDVIVGDQLKTTHEKSNFRRDNSKIQLKVIRFKIPELDEESINIVHRETTCPFSSEDVENGTDSNLLMQTTDQTQDLDKMSNDSLNLLSSKFNDQEQNNENTNITVDLDINLPREICSKSDETTLNNEMEALNSDIDLFSESSDKVQDGTIDEGDEVKNESFLHEMNEISSKAEKLTFGQPSRNDPDILEKIDPNYQCLDNKREESYKVTEIATPKSLPESQSPSSSVKDEHVKVNYCIKKIVPQENTSIYSEKIILNNNSEVISNA